MTVAPSLDLGAFSVVARPSEVSAFRAATRCGGDDGGIPLTFPMRWLAQPDARRALLELVSNADLVPVHESQTFEYARPLSTDEPYMLALRGRREVAPDRLVVDGVVTDADGAAVVRLEMILRLFRGQAVTA